MTCQLSLSVSLPQLLQRVYPEAGRLPGGAGHLARVRPQHRQLHVHVPRHLARGAVRSPLAHHHEHGRYVQAPG